MKNEANKKKVIKWLDAQIKAYNNRKLQLESEQFYVENLAFLCSESIQISRNVDEIAEMLDTPVYSQPFIFEDSPERIERWFMYKGFKFLALYNKE